MQEQWCTMSSDQLCTLLIMAYTMSCGISFSFFWFFLLGIIKTQQLSITPKTSAPAPTRVDACDYHVLKLNKNCFIRWFRKRNSLPHPPYMVRAWWLHSAHSPFLLPCIDYSYRESHFFLWNPFYVFISQHANMQVCNPRELKWYCHVPGEFYCCHQYSDGSDTLLSAKSLCHANSNSGVTRWFHFN